MPETEWRIYYDDNSTFTNRDGTWEEAPTDGVACVVDYTDEQKRIAVSADFYWRTAEEPATRYSNDINPYLRKLGLVKFGRWTDTPQYEQTLKIATHEKNKLTVGEWCIYYDDNSTFSSKDGAWEAAPCDGVLVVAYVDPTVPSAHQEHHRNDYYWWEDGEFRWTADLNPLLRKLGHIKFGRWSTDEKFMRILFRAVMSSRRDPHPVQISDERLDKLVALAVDPVPEPNA